MSPGAGTTMLVVSRDELETIISAAVERGVRAAAKSDATEILTRDEAAAVLGVHPQVLIRYVRNEGLVGMKVGPTWRFRRSDIETWLTSRATARGGHTEHHGKRLRAIRGGV